MQNSDWDGDQGVDSMSDSEEFDLRTPWSRLKSEQV